MQITKECIEGCKKGDRSSQKELFDALLPYLNAICRRYLSNTSLRQDILQDSFISIFQRIDQYNPERGAVHSWCSRIVINNCLKQNKKGKRFFEFLPIKHERAVNPEVVGAMSDEDLVNFLKRMPDKYYEVFMLYVVDGFSHDEIAVLLGIKVELSRKRLARARVWLQSNATGLETLLGNQNLIMV